MASNSRRPTAAAGGGGAAEDWYTPAEGVAAAHESVAKAFRTGVTKPLAWRKQQLRQVSRMLREQREPILEALRKDLHKSRFESLMAEVMQCEREVDHLLSHMDNWAAPKAVSNMVAFWPGSCRIEREPLGSVLIIAPFNYPFMLALAPLILAIGTGNTAVLKPSELSPHTSRVIAECVSGYLDTECFRVVNGAIPETTQLLALRWDHIFYTGSPMVGKIVMRAAAEHLTPVTLELGGKCPAIVDKNVTVMTAARRIIGGKLLSGGQSCTSPDYLMVHEDVHDEFVAALQRALREQHGEDPRQSADLPCIINARHVRRLRQAIANHGGTMVTGDMDAWSEEDRYVPPTILTDITPESPIMQEEIFGPILPIMRYSDVQEAIEYVNRGEKPLALYVFTNNMGLARSVVRATSSGSASVNDCTMHVGVLDLPFGGVGTSGMGKYHGEVGFRQLSHEKGVLERGYLATVLDLPARYPPFSMSDLWLIKLGTVSVPPLRDVLVNKYTVAAAVAGAAFGTAYLAKHGPQQAAENITSLLRSTFGMGI